MVMNYSRLNVRVHENIMKCLGKTQHLKNDESLQIAIIWYPGTRMVVLGVTACIALEHELFSVIPMVLFRTM